jgi:hypothetical protein
VAFAHSFNNAFAFTLTRLTEKHETGSSPAVLALTAAVGALCAFVMWQRTRADRSAST